MTFLLWVGLYPIIFVSWTSGALLSSDPVLMFAKEGDRVILPCGLSVGSCSSMNWTEKFLAWENELVTAGKVTDSNEKKYHLLKDCSLEISHMERNYATMYYCKHGEQNWGVFLQIIDINESQTAAEDTIELHCSLSRYTGYVPCNDTRIHINWTTAGDVPITGKRFRFENPSVCFSKLIITKKITDHHRTWKCQVVLNEEVKATASYETRVKEGLEEVFTPVVWPDEITCSVYREGSLMASKSWHSVKSKQILTWMGLLLGLLMCAVTGGLFIYFKRNKDPCTESGSGTPPLNFPFWIM
ncbi:PREDICTED: uncharacterized protein LOC107102533 isoform X2 [Cyprinodon variegatus]|uniref:uncharacterized protein LOC107102533 isoform X2 n=1 Tax=Cyprinodon variegatus TaxID=28743 RepID=UPI000742C8A4|nr:PREDICTED: uncharacterized protein LOC107102533 isoform X2 [Cyprinodon variegatus]